MKKYVVTFKTDRIVKAVNKWYALEKAQEIIIEAMRAEPTGLTEEMTEDMIVESFKEAQEK